MVIAKRRSRLRVDRRNNWFRLADHARPLRIELPAWNEELHGLSVVARAQPLTEVELVGLVDFVHVELDAQSRPLRDLDMAALDLQRRSRQALPVLPDPVGVDRGHA